MEKKPLSSGLKKFFGVGDLGFTLMSNVEVFYFAYFLTNIAKFDLGTTAIIMTLTSTIDMVLSPFYGGFIDALKPMKWGKYRSWLLVIPPIVVVLYTFMFTIIGTGIVPIVIICVAFLTSHIAWNFSYVANIALIPTISSSPEDRTQLSATRGAYANVGKIIFSAMGLTTILWVGGAVGNPVLGFTISAFAMACVYWLGYFIHFKLTSGYEVTYEEATANTNVAQKEKISVGDMFRSLVQNPHLLVLLLADVARWTVNFVCAGSAVYFFTYVANDVAMFTVYLLVANIMAVIGSYLSKYVAAKLSTRTAALIGCYGLGIFLIGCQFVVGNIMLVLIVLSCAQFFLGFLYALMVALYGDASIYSEWKTGKEASGWVMGLSNLPLKLGIFIKGLIIPAMLAAAGFVAKMDPATATPELKAGITTLFCTIPGCTVLAGAVLLTFGYRLTKEKVTQYQIEIDARNKITE